LLACAIRVSRMLLAVNTYYSPGKQMGSWCVRALPIPTVRWRPEGGYRRQHAPVNVRLRLAVGQLGAPPVWQSRAIRPWTALGGPTLSGFSGLLIESDNGAHDRLPVKSVGCDTVTDAYLSVDH